MNLNYGKRGGAPRSEARDGSTVKGEDHRAIQALSGCQKKGLASSLLIMCSDVRHLRKQLVASPMIWVTFFNTSNAVRLIQRNLEPTAGPQLHALIQSALSSVERAGAYCRNISKFPGPESSFNESIDLGQTLLGIRDLIYLIAGPSINIKFELQPSALAISCNEQDLENVILNLVINARDAMPDGGSFTFSLTPGTVYWTHVDPKHNCSDVVLCVRDTGCGMSPEVARQVFQLSSATKAVGMGSGIGLATVHNFSVSLAAQRRLKRNKLRHLSHPMYS